VTRDAATGATLASRRSWLERRGRTTLVCFAVAALFGWELLLPGRILLPISVETMAPWAAERSATSAPPRSNPTMVDSLVLTLPGRAYNGAALRARRLPFWNPHVFCGYPYLALIQNNALYPLSAPFDVLSPWRGLALSILLHLGIAGATMAAFLRRRGIDPRAALVAGLAFELNGFFLVQLGAPSYVFSGTWLPLVLLGVDRLRSGRRVKHGLAIAGGTALSVLGGHPQITSLVLATGGAFLVWQELAASATRDPAAPEASKASASSPSRAAEGARRDGSLAGRARDLGKTAWRFAFLVLLGVGLAGFQVVPFLELMSVSARGEVPSSALVHSALPAQGLLQALLPGVFGHPVDGDYWFASLAHLLDGVPLEDRYWGFNASADNLFTGWAPLVLAVVALRHAGRRRADVGFFAALAVASLAIALGTPALGAAHALLPGFRVSRPDRVLYLYVASLTALAGYGFDAVLRRERDDASPALAAAALAAGIAVIAWPLAPALATPERRAALGEWVRRGTALWSAQGGRAALEVAATGTVLALCALLARRPRTSGTRLGYALWVTLVLAPQFWFGWKFNPVQRAPRLGETAAERLLVAQPAGARIARIAPSTVPLLPANAAGLLGLDDVHGASSAAVGDYAGLITAADPRAVQKQKYFRSFTDDAVARTRLLDLLSVGTVLSDRELGPPLVPLGDVDGIRLYRNPGRLPRFFLVSRVEGYATPEEGRARLLAPGFDPATTALLLAPLPALAPASVAAAPEVVVERFDEGQIELRVRTPGDALLVTSEAFYPGWEAWLDGENVETRLVDLAFRGVLVPRGEHRVRMAYLPRTFYSGLVASFVSLVLVGWIAWLPATPARQGATSLDGGVAVGASPAR
jgi:hypothetical protein